MAKCRTDQDFAKLMSQHKVSCEQFLSEFEAFATREQVSAIVSGRGDVSLLSQHLEHLDDLHGDMEGLQLSEQQIAKYRLQASELLAKHRKLLEGLCRLCVELFNAHSEDYFESSGILGKNFGEQSRLVRLVTSNFHNFSDCCVEFCLALSHIEFLFSDYVKPLLTKWFHVHSTKSECQKLVRSALGFTYNMLYKNNPAIYDRLTRLQVVEPVMAFTQSPVFEIKVAATLLIAFALDGSKTTYYNGATDVMQFLVTGLRESLDLESRRYIVPTGIQGYHSIELSVCLNRLALSEENKRLLVELGLLPVLHAMCSRGREDEVAAALDILLTLSTRRENQPLIREQFSDVISKLLASTEPLRSAWGFWRNFAAMQGLRQFVKLGDGPAADSAGATGEAPGPPALQRQFSKLQLDPSFSSWDFVLDDAGKKQLIGAGGFGQVYKAFTDKYQTVAVKVIKLMNACDVKQLQNAIKQEKDGIEILKDIQHNNIVAFLKCESTASGKFCIFTELISGCSLLDLMKRQRKAFDETAVRTFSLQICSALNFLHCGRQRPILHRDIKCSNIMLTNEGVIKLIDFGLAREIVSNTVGHSTNHACGTWYFMAPELFLGEKAQYSAKSDVWAFGCTVFEMLDMQPPNWQLRMEQIPMALEKKDMPQLPQQASASLQDFYRRCTVKNPRERAGTAELLQHRFLG